MFVGIGVNLVRGGASSSPASLFAASEPGAWYDPSDLTTLFTDNAGTTPVTAPNQTVGLMLDKSQGLALGPERITNGDFASGTGWTVSGGWTIGSGVAAYTGSGVAATMAQGVSLVAGSFYQVTVTLVVSSGSFTPRFAGGTTVSGTVRSASGTFTDIIQAVTGNNLFQMLGSATAVGSIDNISVKLLAGNHATQATSTQRPIYGINPITGTRNLLTYSSWSDAVGGSPGTAPTGWSFFFNTGSTSLSGGLDAEGAQAIKFDATVGQRISYNQSANVVAGNTYSLSADVVAVSGSGGVVVSIASGTAVGTSTNVVTPGTGRVTATYVCTTSGTVGLRIGLGVTVGVPGTCSITFKQPQFEVGTVATAYQKVVSQYEVTQTGVASASYIAFDGVDDGMVTGTITPATDTVQVFAGVRKLSDAAAIIYETSVAAFSNAGAISAFSGYNGTVTGAYWSVYSHGSAPLVAATTGSTFAAPNTAVVTQIADIAAPTNTLRVNATQQAAVTTTQGTGNYLAYPLYIGRRGGSLLPFNGRIYSLIVRFGPNLTTGQITATESWVNGETGAY